jgi:hypothetical protein
VRHFSHPRRTLQKHPAHTHTTHSCRLALNHTPTRTDALTHALAPHNIHSCMSFVSCTPALTPPLRPPLASPAPFYPPHPYSARHISSKKTARTRNCCLRCLPIRLISNPLQHSKRCHRVRVPPSQHPSNTCLHDMPPVGCSCHAPAQHYLPSPRVAVHHKAPPGATGDKDIVELTRLLSGERRQPNLHTIPLLQPQPWVPPQHPRQDPPQSLPWPIKRCPAHVIRASSFRRYW